MRNILLSLLLATSISSCANSEELNFESVEIPLIITPGSIAEIDYTQTRIKNGESKIGRVTGLLEILEVTDNEYSATWTTKSVKVGNVTVDETSPQASSLYIGVPFTYIGISDGQPVKIQDKEKLIASVIKSPTFKNTGTEIMDQVGKFFGSMDEETIAHVFVKAPSYMSVCQETNLVIGDILESQSESPSPFGEGVLLSDITYLLKEDNPKKGIAKIEYRSAFNSESVTAVAIQAIKKLDSEKKISQEEIDKLSIDRKDSANCTVDTKTGWVRTMNYSTSTTADGENHGEVFDISVKWME